MRQESWSVEGMHGHVIPGTLTRQDGTHLAILLPGLSYRNTMPAMHLSRMLMLERRADVLAVDYAYDQIPAFRQTPDDERLAWIGADGCTILSAVLDLGSYERITIIGKSLGTVAMGWAIPGEPRLAGADLVWLTPSLVGTGLGPRIRSCRGRAILVIGTADDGHDTGAMAEFACAGLTVVTLERVNHGVERPGDTLGTLAAWTELVRHVGDWVDSRPR